MRPAIWSVGRNVDQYLIFHYITMPPGDAREANRASTLTISGKIKPVYEAEVTPMLIASQLTRDPLHL